MQKKLLVLILAVLLVGSLLAVTGCHNGGSSQFSDRYVDLYAINDFHGATDKIATIGAYLKDCNNGNAVFINSGDMFQGSMESNANWGMLLDDCMEEIGFDCMTLGNHEFDWGLEKLKAVIAQSKVKYLCANLYYWDNDTKSFGDYVDDIADPYIIKELNNGLRVGVIGIIGASQITSISSNLVENVGFKEPKTVVPALAQELRNEKNCDVVVVSTHDGASDVIDDSYLSLHEYADAVFCAHSHREENMEKQGVPFLQGGSNGEYISRIRLAVGKSGKVSCTKKQNIDTYSISQKDTAVQKLVDDSNAKIKDMATEELGTLQGGYISSSTAVPRLACKAIADYALTTQVGKDIDMAVVNNGRDSIDGGTITYSDLYKALPFDNVVYVAQVSGYDLMRMAGVNSYGKAYNSIWRVTGRAVKTDDLYTIAVIDYLLFHQGYSQMATSSRNYDYFPSAFENGRQPIALSEYNYREITKNYIKAQGTIVADEFYQTSNRTNNALLSKDVTFDDAQVLAINTLRVVATNVVQSAILPSEFKWESTQG